MKPSEILLQIKRNPYKQYGICTCYNKIANNMDTTCFETISAYLGVSFKNWPEFSGSLMYPIKSYDERIANSFMYNLAGVKNAMWDRRTKYGKARWQLLDWLIEQFQAKGQ